MKHLNPNFTTQVFCFIYNKLFHFCTTYVYFVGFLRRINWNCNSYFYLRWHVQVSCLNARCEFKSIRKRRGKKLLWRTKFRKVQLAEWQKAKEESNNKLKKATRCNFMVAYFGTVFIFFTRLHLRIRIQENAALLSVRSMNFGNSNWSWSDNWYNNKNNR